MATQDSSGTAAPIVQLHKTDGLAVEKTNSVRSLERRLQLAYEANSRALELIEALRPYIDRSDAIELPTLLFSRLDQLCNVSYDLTSGIDLNAPGCGIDDLEKILLLNEIEGQ